MHDSARRRSIAWDESCPMTALGGTGSEVFRAPSVDGDRYVAVRLWCGTSREEMDAAIARIQTANRVEHESLARVEGWDARGNAALWIVSEYVPGPSLERWIARGRSLPVPGAIDLVRNLCLGLFAANREGLSHHSVHPGNLLVARHHREQDIWLEAKLVDLSLAAWMQPEWPSLTHSHFIAPETLASMLDGFDPSDEIDARANVYSCGAMLYWLVTGALPFRSQGPWELATAHESGKLWAPQGHNPDVSDSLQTVILGALSVKPSGRYVNTGELASALAAVAYRDGFAEAYEPSVVAPLPLMQPRERRESSVQETRMSDEITDLTSRTERSRVRETS